MAKVVKINDELAAAAADMFKKQNMSIQIAVNLCLEAGINAIKNGEPLRSKNLDSPASRTEIEPQRDLLTEGNTAAKAGEEAFADWMVGLNDQQRYIVRDKVKLWKKQAAEEKTEGLKEAREKWLANLKPEDDPAIKINAELQAKLKAESESGQIGEPEE